MSYNTSSTDWNLALPSCSQHNDTILPIIINNTTFAISLSKVHYIDYPEALTPLPFSNAPVEGLVSFNGKPLLQLNVAQALNTENRSEGKVVIIAWSQENLALRVEEVLSFISTQEESSEQHYKNLPLLKLDELFPWLKTIVKQDKPATDNTFNTFLPTDEAALDTSALENKKIDDKNLSHYILLVSSGEKTIGLLADTIERIEQIDDVSDIRSTDNNVDNADFIARIENNLFPARSLAHFINVESRSERQALMFHEGKKVFVLAVERISSLEKVDHFHLTFHSGKNRLWHLNEKGEMIEVISIKECFGKTDDYKTLKITDPRLQWNNMPQLAAKLSTEGVRVQCADATFVLPLSLVNRILGDLTELNIPTAQTDETLIDNEEKLLSSEQSDKIPVIDCVKLIKPDSGECANTYLLLSLACGYVIIGVSRTALQPTLPEQQWSKLALLPPPSSLFFDAATFDDVDKKWVLRIKADIDFSLFPWHIKRQCVTALVSWIDEKYLEEIDV